MTWNFSTPGDLFSLLLDRHVAIQQWIANPLKAGAYLKSVKRLLWTPQGPDTTPVFLNYNAGFKNAVYTKDFWQIDARVGSRLLAGPLSGGVIGAHEDALNDLIMALVNQYARFDHLQTPDENGNPTYGGEFVYLAAGDTPVVPSRNSGMTVYTYGRDPASQVRFFGTEFVIECSLRVKRK